MEGPQRFELMGQTPQKEKKKKNSPQPKQKQSRLHQVAVVSAPPCPDAAKQHKAARRLIPHDCAGGRGVSSQPHYDAKTPACTPAHPS